MKRSDTSPGIRLAVVAVVLLLLGLVVELAFTQPRLREIKSLTAQRTKLLETAGSVPQTDRDVEDLAQRLAAEDLTPGLAAQRARDPLTYLGEEMERAQLTRLDLRSQGGETVGSMRRTRYSVRVEGSYSHILGFLRKLEQGPLLVTVGALSMEPIPESSTLEGRIDLDLYNLPGRP